MTNPTVPPNPPVVPPHRGMPKWLIIVLVILIIIVVGCCGGITMCFVFARHAATTVGGAIQEAAKVQMTKEGVDFDTTGAGLSLPANFPSDVPVYSGFKAFSKVAPPGQAQGTVLFKGSTAPDTVGSYYESEMGKAGWTQSQSNAAQGTIAQEYTKDNTTVSINITSGNGQTMLRISYGAK